MTDTPPLGPLPEPDAWRITDGEGGYSFRDDEPEPSNVAWAARYGRRHESLFTADQMRAYALQERERCALTDKHIRAVVRSVQPHLGEGCKAWRELEAECRYWLEADRAQDQG